MSGVRVTRAGAFVTGPLTGNQLAVAWGADRGPAGQIQALAGELGPSQMV